MKITILAAALFALHPVEPGTLLGSPEQDLEIPGRPFTFGQLITAQAAGDASVLAEHGRPVLALTLTDPGAALSALRGALK